MTEKEITKERFIDIEHDYENARIKCKDNGMFMLYAIYENDNGLPTLGDLLNEQDKRIKELEKENEELKWSKKILRANKKDCELGRRYEREQWLKMDNMRVEQIQFYKKRLKKNGLSIYINDGDAE